MTETPTTPTLGRAARRRAEFAAKRKPGAPRTRGHREMTTSDVVNAHRGRQFLRQWLAEQVKRQELREHNDAAINELIELNRSKTEEVSQ